MEIEHDLLGARLGEMRLMTEENLPFPCVYPWFVCGPPLTASRSFPLRHHQGSAVLILRVLQKLKLSGGYR